MRYSSLFGTVRIHTRTFFSSRYVGNDALKPLLGAAEAVSMQKELTFVDGSWFLPGVSRDPEAEFEAERIPGARRMNMEALCDPDNDLPHMLPTVEGFNEWARSNGLSPDAPVVIYATKDSFSSPRIWWTFKVFNHGGSVSILDGGLEAWKAAGGDIEAGPPTTPISRSDYTSPGINDALVVNTDQVQEAMVTGAAQICDARPEQRFSGEVSEPRPGLARGHIPGSLSLPFASLLHPDDKTTFLPPIQIRAKLTQAGIIPGSKVMMTCGSGVTACTLAFAMALIGQPPENAPVYDGSWAEWGQPTREDLPKMVTWASDDDKVVNGVDVK